MSTLIERRRQQIGRAKAEAAMKNAIDNAGNSVAYELHLYAHTIGEEYQVDFFHPCNRDAWVQGFCEWLSAKQRKSAEVRASND